MTAGSIYEEVLRSAPTDTWAMGMLAYCYEQQGRHVEGLQRAEEALRWHPDSLLALQAAARLAIATHQHAKAAGYLERALALPEVTAEIPMEVTPPKWVTWLFSVLAALPILSPRVRRSARSALKDLDPGTRALELQDWKHWAQDFLAWHAGSEPPSHGGVAH